MIPAAVISDKKFKKKIQRRRVYLIIEENENGMKLENVNSSY